MAYISREYNDHEPAAFSTGPIYKSPHRDILSSSDSEHGFSSDSNDTPSLFTSRSGDSASSSGSDTGTHETSNPASHDSTTSSDTENPSSSDSESDSAFTGHYGYDNGHGDVSSGDSGSGYTYGYGDSSHEKHTSESSYEEDVSSSDYYESVSTYYEEAVVVEEEFFPEEPVPFIQPYVPPVPKEPKCARAYLDFETYVKYGGLECEVNFYQGPYE